MVILCRSWGHLIYAPSTCSLIKSSARFIIFFIPSRYSKTTPISSYYFIYTITILWYSILPRRNWIYDSLSELNTKILHDPRTKDAKRKKEMVKYIWYNKGMVNSTWIIRNYNSTNVTEYNHNCFECAL